MDEFIEKNVAIARLTALEIGNPCATMTDAKRQIADTRPADVAPVVHGRWVPTKAPFMNECEDCSVCGYRTVWGHRYNYCPNCGAKMDGGGSDEAD